jgi:hypothetical protein
MQLENEDKETNMSNDIRDVMYNSHQRAQLGNSHIHIHMCVEVLLAAIICPWPLYFLAYAIVIMWL